jgi:hypothetical protein
VPKPNTPVRKPKKRARKPRRRLASKRVSYSWALHLDASQTDPARLSGEAEEGLEYAAQLANDAKERSQDPTIQQKHGPLTIEQLADEAGLPVAVLQAQIRLARRKLFGALTDAAIAKRAQRKKDAKARTCAESGCRREIPPAAHGNRRYCPSHATGKARAQRHRAANSATTGHAQ